MKAVLDVGQLVSATFSPHGHPAQIFNKWRHNEFILVTSLPLLDDLRRVLRYPHIQKRHRWNEEQIDLFVDALTMATMVTRADIEVGAVRADSTDNKVVACAVAGQADYIVASDEHLVKLRSIFGIPIVSPRYFLEVLEKRKQ